MHEEEEVRAFSCRIDNVKTITDILNCLCIDPAKAPAGPMSAKKPSSSGGGVETKITVLESSSILPHAYQSWKDDTELMFRSKGLHRYLTDEEASVFAEREPVFCWELETEIEEHQRKSGVKKDLRRDFMEAAAAQASTPETNQVISEALSKMFENIDALTEQKREQTPAALDEDEEPARRSFKVESPDSEGFKMAATKRTTTSLEFYYRRLDAHVSARESYSRRKKEFESKLDEAQDLLVSTLSLSVRTTLKNEIPTRRVDLIWAKLKEKCGPRSGTEGLADLEKTWSRTEIEPTEAMTDFLQRLERTATKFDAYGPAWRKTDGHKVVLVRQALVNDENFADWRREIRDADRMGEDWEDLKTRLERLAGEILADRALAKGAQPKGGRAEKAAAAKTAGAAAPDASVPDGKGPRGGRVRETEEERAARVAKATCNLCGECGHFGRDCSWVTEFRKMKADATAKKTKAVANDKSKVKPSAAPAKEESGEGDGEGEVGCAACQAKEPEPFEDWLESSQGESAQMVQGNGDSDEESEDAASEDAESEGPPELIEGFGSDGEGEPYDGTRSLTVTYVDDVGTMTSWTTLATPGTCMLVPMTASGSELTESGASSVQPPLLRGHFIFP
ncbi:hypothetical protein B484DRAFT_404628 [Ochromonadaceae sp. CCMP2298]|nr:hypothetical protein B484DRAFT_404628 [Ochromonadaceae sp. CCMP2298]